MADLYTCRYCGKVIDWDEPDDANGHIWGCEWIACGKTFCTKCATDLMGDADYTTMMHGYGPTLCPDCWKEGGTKEAKEDTHDTTHQNLA